MHTPFKKDNESHQAAANSHIGAAPVMENQSWMSKYTKGRKLGAGSFGTVDCYIKNENNREVAIKAIKKAPTHSLERHMVEKNVLEYLTAAWTSEFILVQESPRSSEESPAATSACAIIPKMTSSTPQLSYATSTFDALAKAPFTPLYDSNVDSASTISLVMPMYQSGDYKVACCELTLNFKDERLLKGFARDLLKSVAWIHEKGVSHLDLKPDNLLMRSEERLLSPVIADFGFSTMERQVNSFRGTPGYIAPEMVQAETNRVAIMNAGGANSNLALDGAMCDMWSVGSILLFARAGGVNPFRRGGTMDYAWASTKRVDSRLRLPGFGMPELLTSKHQDQDGTATTTCCAMDPLLVDFLSKLLVSDPAKRMSAKEALEHEWLNSQ